MTPHPHIVLFSGGAASAALAIRLREKLGPDERITLLFTDTRDEDEDLYRFLWDAARAVTGDLVIEADGRSIWEVFNDEKMMGSTRADICSRVLKREVSRRWLKANASPSESTIYVGYTWEEPGRFVRFRAAMARDGWENVEAPLAWRPWVAKHRAEEMCRDAGLVLPRMYAEGFPHNNCAGACVKGGLGHWQMLLRLRPDVFARWEREELAHQARHEHTSTILRDRRGGTTKPLSLRALRERVETNPQASLFDEGGFACSCFSDDDLPALPDEAEQVRDLLAGGQ